MHELDQLICLAPHYLSSKSYKISQELFFSFSSPSVLGPSFFTILFHHQWIIHLKSQQHLFRVCLCCCFNPQVLHLGDDDTYWLPLKFLYAECHCIYLQTKWTACWLQVPNYRKKVLAGKRLRLSLEFYITRCGR